MRVAPAYSYAEDLKLTVTVDGKPHRRRLSRGDQFAPQLVYFADCIVHDGTPEPSGGRA